MKLGSLTEVAISRSCAASDSLLARARQSIAGGADSMMRVLSYHLPLAIASADGAFVVDVDGNELIDMNMGYGPLIFGHRPAFLVDAIRDELNRRGTALGFPYDLSHELAEAVKEACPWIELMRFACTGSEVGQTAVRLARAYTGRKHIILFEGHYHGSTDAVYHKYHAPIAALEDRRDGAPLPGTNGMNGAPHDAVVIPWNDICAAENAFRQLKGDVAAVMMEPVAGNMGVVAPRDGYLHALSGLAHDNGALTIFDEVITGFRLARGGAQERLGVCADITTLSKALGGGVPISAVGSRREIMTLLENGSVFHGGVYSGTPMCVAAALATQRELTRLKATVYRNLDAATAQLAGGLRERFDAAGVIAHIQHVGPILSCWPVKRPVDGDLCDYRSVTASIDTQRYIAFQHAAQRAGVYFHPNAYEPWYISAAHTAEVIDTVLDRLDTAIAEIG